MERDAQLPVEDRLYQLLQHLGIERAHFAGGMPLDWAGFVATHPEMISSFTLICPVVLDRGAVSPIASRLLVFGAERGRGFEELRRAVAGLPGATLVTLRDYSPPAFCADPIADCREAIGSAMREFLARAEREQGEMGVPLEEGEGEVAGISYRVQGGGPPLVLFPLGLAPSQWEPLLSTLSERYSTITLGGSELSIARLLETRGRSEGYRGVVRRLVEEVQLEPGETVLEVGCGTGALARWLARHSDGANRIVGADINRYLLREAASLVDKEGFKGQIELREGDAQDLPFPDGSFDVTISSTVMEELDADRMLAEMVRVTKPGGRIGVVVRAVDMPMLPNVRLRDELWSKVFSARYGGVEEGGCADASLYRRFLQAGLMRVKMFPQLGAFTAADEPYLQVLKGFILSVLSPEEMAEWRQAVAQAEGEGTLFIATPYHCAVGRKPG